MRLRTEDDDTRYRGILSLSAAGDRDGLRRSIAELVGRSAPTIGPGKANDVAWWCCSMAPDDMVGMGMVVHLAEIAFEGGDDSSKANCLNTLGAALYRAGRFDDAIRRLEEGIRLRGGASVAQDWAFLAMAHQCLGHRDEARRWLDRFRNRPPDTDPDHFWIELEIRLLRSEAEARILYDPDSPADPFAN